LGYKAQMPFGEARSKFRARGIGAEQYVGDALLAAEIFNTLATRATAGEHKLETRISGVIPDGSGNGFEIVGQAEVP